MWLVIDIRAPLDTALPFAVFTQKPLVIKEGDYQAPPTFVGSQVRLGSFKSRAGERSGIE